MAKFRILFGLDLLILAFALWQCVMLAISPLVAQSPGGAWMVVSPLLTVLVLASAVLGGAAMLHRRGRTGAATLLLLVPAVPILLGGLLMTGLMILFTLGTPSP